MVDLEKTYTKPRKKGYLQVSEYHSVYYELWGNPNGEFVLTTHGGPGGCIRPKHAQLYNLNDYQVLFFDQRGCGKSRCAADKLLVQNTTFDLVDDMAKLLSHFKIRTAIIAGGSWGSTLSLCFAIRYPKLVKRLHIMGIFLGTKQELDDWAKVLELFAPSVVSAVQTQLRLTHKSINSNLFYTVSKKLLTAKSDVDAKKYAYLLDQLESKIIALTSEPEHLDNFAKYKLANGSKIMAHYMTNNFFLPEDYILKHTDEIAHIRTKIIQGRQDLICPPKNSYALHIRLPKSKLLYCRGGHIQTPDDDFSEVIVMFRNML
jgi:proline iminopeptidase